MRMVVPPLTAPKNLGIALYFPKWIDIAVGPRGSFPSLTGVGPKKMQKAEPTGQ